MTFEGRDEILYRGNWMSIIRRDGWYEFSSFLTGGGGVYILAYRDHLQRPILGRFEICPAHNDSEPILTSITGGIPEDKSPKEIAILEMYEEAGYRISQNQLVDLGKVFLSKASDNVAYLYAVDVTNLFRGEAPGDGTKGEEGSYCDWVSLKDAMFCKDPVMSTLILRVFYNEIVKG